MPPYQWFHLENVAWVLLGGLLISMGIILARASREWSFTTAKRSEEQLEAETHEFGGGLREQNRPVPLLIWLVSIGWGIWAAAYIIYSGAAGL